MNLKIKPTILFFFLFITLLTKGGVINDQSIDHSEEHHLHEIGISFAPVYFFGEKELALASHIHYVYNFPDTKIGIGAGYERIFDRDKHNFIGLELNYRPKPELTLNISPGTIFESGYMNEKQFALHFETAYEFEIENLHIGPLIELAWHPEDVHLSFGLHLGLAF